MATNFSQEGKVLDHVSGGVIASGAIVPMGDSIGVALKAAAASGETIAVGVEGVFSLAKTTGTAWVQGDKLDYDASTAKMDKAIAVPAAGDIEDCAYAAADAASGATTGLVKLANPGVVT